MIDFRRCDECGAHYARDLDSCFSCGRFGERPRELFGGRRLPATGGLPTLAVVLAFFVPSPWEPVVVGAGFAPLLVALAWTAWRRGQRDPASFRARIAELQRRLEEVERDLAHTDQRVIAATEDLDVETRPRAAATLTRELDQDRRLRRAQRRLVRQLERRLEQLEIERFRAELRFFERCRDARLDDPALADELARTIDELEAHLGDTMTDAWAIALEEAWLLQRQMSRGVQRLRAAVRLDPLAHADLAGEVANDVSSDEGELDDQVDQHLERIARGFAAVEELASELVGDPDASGPRVRVDDEVLAALDEAEIELEVEPDRVSVDRV